MSFLKRLFSSDYRAAVAAEAAGDLDLAAERYALAGHIDAAVRLHRARAERADTRAKRIDALRDALHWATEDPAVRRVVLRDLGRELLSRARDEGIATERDRERVRDAAAHLLEAGSYEEAGDALEGIGDEQAAARAFAQGGLVVRMEAVLARQSARADKRRTVDESFAQYELHLRLGERSEAQEAIAACVEHADHKERYRHYQDSLDARIIADGRAVLRRRSGGERSPPVVFATGPEIVLGRDSLCEIPLRSGGISRRHCSISRDPAQPGQYLLRDLGSRNGTKIGGLPIGGAVPLLGQGQFDLGDDCVVDYAIADDVATLRVGGGIDRGLIARCGGELARLDLADALDCRAELYFDRRRPFLEPRDGVRLSLNGESIARGAVQLIHGDGIECDGAEIDVE